MEKTEEREGTHQRVTTEWSQGDGKTRALFCLFGFFALFFILIHLHPSRSPLPLSEHS